MEEENNGNTCQVDELRQFELDADFEDVAVVDDGSDNLVVIGEEVVIESFGVWIAAAGRLGQEAETPAAQGRQRQRPGRRARQTAAAITSSPLSVGHRCQNGRRADRMNRGNDFQFSGRNWQDFSLLFFRVQLGR